ALQRASDPFHRSLVHALPHLIGDTTGGPYHARSSATSPSSAAGYSTPSFPRHGKQNVHRWHDSGGRSGRKGEIGRSISCLVGRYHTGLSGTRSMRHGGEYSGHPPGKGATHVRPTTEPPRCRTTPGSS